MAINSSVCSHFVTFTLMATWAFSQNTSKSFQFQVGKQKNLHSYLCRSQLRSHWKFALRSDVHCIFWTWGLFSGAWVLYLTFEAVLIIQNIDAIILILVGRLLAIKLNLIMMSLLVMPTFAFQVEGNNAVGNIEKLSSSFCWLVACLANRCR